MSQSERKMADTTGKILLAVKGDRPLSDASWKQGRILLSNKRLILATQDGKQTYPLRDLRQIGGRMDASIDARQVADYVTLRFVDRTYLVAASDHERFEHLLFKALLHGRSVQVKYPAVEGGVVTDANWETASLTLDEDGLALAIQSGTFVSLDLDELSGIQTDMRDVAGTQRIVIAASHLDREGTIVETHIGAAEPHGEHLRTYLLEGLASTETNVELSETEREVLMALYSGISPFEISTFIDRDIDEVEEIYERLLKVDLVDEIRVRREVRLNARGRNVASGISEEQW